MQVLAAVALALLYREKHHIGQVVLPNGLKHQRRSFLSTLFAAMRFSSLEDQSVTEKIQMCATLGRRFQISDPRGCLTSSSPGPVELQIVGLQTTNL